MAGQVGLRFGAQGPRPAGAGRVARAAVGDVAKGAAGGDEPFPTEQAGLGGVVLPTRVRERVSAGIGRIAFPEEESADWGGGLPGVLGKKLEAEAELSGGPGGRRLAPAQAGLEGVLLPGVQKETIAGTGPIGAFHPKASGRGFTAVFPRGFLGALKGFALSRGVGFGKAGAVRTLRRSFVFVPSVGRSRGVPLAPGVGALREVGPRKEKPSTFPRSFLGSIKSFLRTLRRRGTPKAPPKVTPKVPPKVRGEGWLVSPQVGFGGPGAVGIYPRFGRFVPPVGQTELGGVLLPPEVQRKIFSVQKDLARSIGQAVGVFRSVPVTSGKDSRPELDNRLVLFQPDIAAGLDQAKHRAGRQAERRAERRAKHGSSVGGIWSWPGPSRLRGVRSLLPENWVGVLPNLDKATASLSRWLELLRPKYTVPSRGEVRLIGKLLAGVPEEVSRLTREGEARRGRERVIRLLERLGGLDRKRVVPLAEQSELGGVLLPSEVQRKVLSVQRNLAGSIGQAVRVLRFVPGASGKELRPKLDATEGAAASSGDTKGAARGNAGGAAVGDRLIFLQKDITKGIKLLRASREREGEGQRLRDGKKGGAYNEVVSKELGNIAAYYPQLLKVLESQDKALKGIEKYLRSLWKAQEESPFAVPSRAEKAEEAEKVRKEEGLGKFVGEIQEGLENLLFLRLLGRGGAKGAAKGAARGIRGLARRFLKGIGRFLPAAVGAVGGYLLTAKTPLGRWVSSWLAGALAGEVPEQAQAEILTQLQAGVSPEEIAAGITEEYNITPEEAGEWVRKVAQAQAQAQTLTTLGGTAAGGLGAHVLTRKLAGKAGAKALTKAAGRGWFGKLAGKLGGKFFGKFLGKSVLKKLPLFGLGAAGVFAVSRFTRGDVIGGLMELASGVLSTIPGLGTVGSVLVDLGLAARDVGREMERTSEEVEKAAGRLRGTGDVVEEATGKLQKTGDVVEETTEKIARVTKQTGKLQREVEEFRKLPGEREERPPAREQQTLTQQTRQGQPQVNNVVAPHNVVNVSVHQGMAEEFGAYLGMPFLLR